MARPNDDDDEDWQEFPPTKYPGREVATFIVAVILVVAAVSWVVWKVVAWIW